MAKQTKLKRVGIDLKDLKMSSEASLVTITDVPGPAISGIVSEIRLLNAKDPNTHFRAIFFTYVKALFSCESVADPLSSTTQTLNMKRVIEEFPEGTTPEDAEIWRKLFNFYTHYDEKEYPGIIPEGESIYFNRINSKIVISVQGEDRTNPDLKLVYDQFNVGYVPRPTTVTHEYMTTESTKGKEPVQDIKTRYSW